MSALPAKIGGYTTRGLLARTPTAEVFLAEAPDGEPVCLKRVLLEHCQDPAFVADFTATAEAALTLHHPNLVRVHAYGEDAGYWLAMDLVRGPSLAQMLAHRKPLGAELVAAVGVGVARALAYLHQSDPAAGRRTPLIHCDVSPHNVLIDSSGAVRLTDFGIAKALGATGAATLTRERGRPGYFAPEQLDAAPRLTGNAPSTITSAVDLFALGLVLWQALVGTHPYVERCPPGSSLAQWLPVALAGNVRRRVVDAAPMAPAGLCDAIEALLQPIETRTPTAERALARLFPFADPRADAALGRLAMSTPRGSA